ncbi:MAG: hypothetical protein HRT38_05420 [Alteromonadaceae bacterium]|nr:hypothetical protein [Alteromonadaceae bacterium]
MDATDTVKSLTDWIASIQGEDGQYGLVEDWLLRGKLNRVAIAQKLGLEPATFEQKCHLDLATKACDEFANMLRQKGIIKIDVNIKRFDEMVSKLSGDDGKYLAAHEFVSGSKLNRKKIIEEFAIGKKAITGKRPENPELARMLNRFEDMLRSAEFGIIPIIDTIIQKSEQSNTSMPKGAISVSEAAKLHQRILELESENEALKGNYGRFSEVAEVYRRLGEMK